MSLRVAFFTDSFREANGVALTSREYVRFFQEKGFPLFSVHPGPERHVSQEGPVTTLELPSSRMLLGLEHDLAFDLMVMRHSGVVKKALQDFKPDLVHITGPGHCGMLGAILAHRMRIPVASSWHTNLHEYAGRRTEKLLRWLPRKARETIGGIAENGALHFTALFYRIPRIIFAPNPELVEMLHRRTGRPCFLMLRGIDTARFSPDYRNRADDGDLTLGYVGRLSPEKNVRVLAEIERGLEAAGIERYRFLIVGDGSEREWLKKNLKRAELPGVLRGDPLSVAYANMDLFLFPSETDTFGNVVLEAMASGVPPVVAASGGPKFIVRSGVNGFTAQGMDEFVRAVIYLMQKPGRRREMSRAAREHALAQSWESIFQSVYERYLDVLSPFEATRLEPSLVQ